ncbi:Outer membrane receptor proteins, mostly Fe transport [Chitinophaga costaii]|uniref:Outer membrane receptor proteins, mostly Fe transport n=1 Tax=Chitinophaga costaii TaxID=1335309 RepID=A0A1C4DE59_9BACT|nr:outer membrane beta-barrel family protein [Chitinophaga costaii]PUZ24589.1 TonB-dependent receptor [Chitinophaga costaii]SCC29665.1 Outer membrane receptor proteins, mostly Fe transport [Chitinophaga costaii]
MKRLSLLLGMLLICYAAFAQFGALPGGGKGAQAPPKIGHVFGRVVDQDGKPVPEVAVILLQNRYDSITKKRKDFLFKGVNTTGKGEFSFEELPIMGPPMKLKISLIGYKTIELPVAFQLKMPAGGMKAPQDPAKAMAAASDALSQFEKDLGVIKMETDSHTLEGVTVTGSKPLMQMDIDKKVFNVEKNIVSVGGTAVDVMRNVPSVQVDIDGNVKLRNAVPQIYVEGRPTTLSLDQIPADAIESVEVITNPSAKYDASGGNAGILNIILKKNRKTGYNGNVMAGADIRGGYNGGGSFNVRQGKFNVTATAMVNAMRNKTTGTTDRTNFGDTAVHIDQENNNKTNGQFVFGNLGLDYFATNHTSFSIAGIKVHGKFKPGEVIDINTDSLLPSGTVNNFSQRLTHSAREFNANGLQAGFKHSFAKEGEEWTADLNYFSGRSKFNADYNTNYYDASHTLDGTQLQQQIGTGKNKFLTIQTDYVKPFTAKTKLEAGLRAQIRNTENYNDTYVQYNGMGTPVLLAGATSDYKNHDNVYAAYASVTSGFGNFGYQLGLRGESSNYDGKLTNTGQKFSNRYPISLFPSVFLSQKLKHDQELQLSYTRRVNRPNFFQLIPYTDFTDSLNITRGNPDLVPEFTNSVEGSYSKTFKGNHNILFSLYYKHTNDLITRYLQAGINPGTGKSDIINTYINASSSYTTGAEFTSTNPVTKWLDITTNVNVYNGKINAPDSLASVEQDAMWSWFGKFNSNVKLPKNFSVQISADYQSKTNLPINNNQQQFGPPSSAQSASQGYIRSFWGMDAAVKKTFLKNNAAAVTLSISDIFRTRLNSQFSQSEYFVQNYARLANPQLVKLNFTYRFGKIDTAVFKRKNMKMQGEGMQGASMGQ